MNDDRSSLEGTSTSRLKRKIPSVTEVLDELARLLMTDPYGKANLFVAAQRVCAEELRRVRVEGGESASLRILAERARALLDPSRRTHSDPEPVPSLPPAADAPAPATMSLEEEPFDLSSPLAPNPSFVIPPPGDFTAGESDSLVFAPPPAPAPLVSEPVSAPVPADVRVPVPAAVPPPTSPRAAPRTSSFTPVITHPPQKHPALRLFLWIVIAGAVLGVGYYYFHLRGWRPRVGSAAAARTSPRISARTMAAHPPAPLSGSASASRPTISPRATATTSVASPAPLPVTARPSSLPAVAASKPENPPSRRETVEPGQSRPGTMVSADWEGKPPVYMLHFSSYKSRENASRDADRLAKKLGKTAHVLPVDLGAEGHWYRVMVGDFATAEEALAFRAELAAQKTSELGLAFRVTGPGR